GHPRGLEHRHDRAPLLVEERLEHVLRAHLGVARPLREALRLGEGFLALGGELVESHAVLPVTLPSIRSDAIGRMLGWEGLRAEWRYDFWPRRSLASPASGLFGYFWMSAL